MKELFCQNLKRLRKQKELNQEQLAQALDITVQAVSKWECGLSYPDIETLLLLADLLEVSVDELLRASYTPVPHNLPELPDDNTLRILQCVGNHIIKQDQLNQPDFHNPPISLTLKNNSENNMENPIHVEIWGSAEIDGDIFGSVNAGDSLTCQDIHGDAHAGDSINCGYIDGDAHAGDSINCGDIDGDVNAGDGIHCGDIDGNAHAGDGINCGNIDGDICSCGGNIHCSCVNGSIHCDGDIYLNNSENS